MTNKDASKQLFRGLKEKKRKPSWLSRYCRKKLLDKIIIILKEGKVSKAWAHEDLVSAVEKKPRSIVLYVEFESNDENGFAHSVDSRMDTRFDKYNINIIDVKTLLPTIKKSIFKELVQIV